MEIRLAAAIAAGETPSPEMVAASGSKEGLRPAIAWTLLAVTIMGCLGIMAINDHFMLHRRIPFKIKPEILAERSRQFLNKIGYSEEFADSAYGLEENSSLLDAIDKSGNSADRWERLDARAVLFWYRQSPRRLDYTTGLTYDNPPLQYPEEALIVTDTEGHLVLFRCVPPPLQSSSETPRELNWTAFFNEAGIDQETEVNPQRNPPFYADIRKAWQGSFSDKPDEHVSIEAASLQGKPVSFEIAGSWPWSATGEMAQPSLGERISNIIRTLVILVIVAGGIFFARRNMRLGRGDRRNAIRLALFVQTLMIMMWLLKLPHSSWLFLLISFVVSSLIWVLYMAIEPFARRRWPHLLVTWTRLLSGDWKDPIVARDVLMGASIGAISECYRLFVAYVIPSRFAFGESPPPEMFSLQSVLGTLPFLSVIPYPILEGILMAFSLTFILFILRVLLRSQIAAVVVSTLLLTLTSPNPWLFMVYLPLFGFLFIGMTRFGLLAFSFCMFTFMIFRTFPIPLDASAWYAGYGYAALAILAAIVLYAFRTSLGGRPLLASSHLDD